MDSQTQPGDHGRAAFETADEVLLPAALVRDGSNSTEGTFESQSGQRLEPRYEYPFEVQINGDIYKGADLSVGGMSVSPRRKLQQGDEVSAAIQLLHGKCECLDVVCVVRRISGERASLAFKDLDEEEAARLEHAFRSWLDDGDTADQPTSAFQARHERSHIQPKLLGIFATSAFALLLIAGGIAFLVGRITAVVPAYAAVAEETLTVRASEGGTIEWLPDIDAVRAGEVVAVLATAKASQSALELEAAISASERNVRARAAASRDAQATFGAYRDTASITLAQAKSAAASAAAQLKLQQGKVERVSALHAKGFASRDLLDQEQFHLASLERQLVEAKTAVHRADVVSFNATQGLYVNEGRSTQPSPVDTGRELAEATDELRHLRSLRASTSATQRVFAPCDCAIAARLVKRGEYVGAGEVLLKLTRRNHSTAPASTVVEALIPLSESRKLEIGSDASVELPGTGRSYPGKVVRATYNLDAASSGGLPAQLLTNGGYALVVIHVPTTPDLAKIAGATPVAVRIRTSLAKALAL